MSQDKIRDLLTRQKLVEEVVHGQTMNRQALVETVLHRQHLAELQSLALKMSPREIGSLLESLPLREARELWQRIPIERENDVLWELPEDLRQELAGDQEPQFGDSQLNAFELVDGRLQQVTISGRKDLENSKPIWVDLLGASAAERRYIGDHYGLALPDPGESTDLEVSTRFQIQDDNSIHLHSNFLLDREGEARSVPVLFILQRGTLFSVRNEKLPVFRLQRQRARTQADYVTDGIDLLLDLYGADVEYSADALESIYQTLGLVGRQVLSEQISDEEAASILARIAEEENLNGQIRSNILDTQRALTFLIRCKLLSPGQLEDVQQILRNIDSLNNHTAFLFDKINFLMDATIGFININQNKRVNQLTVFGVVFMPINILAGIGGMSEFSMMTEGIPWPLAYGGFITCMSLIGWGTYLLVKRLDHKKLRAAQPPAG